MKFIGIVLCILVILFCLDDVSSYKCLPRDEATGNPPQVIFGHIYKTGGSTIREIFRNYATQCNFSIAVLVNCDKGQKEALLPDTNTAVLPCMLKEYEKGDRELKVDEEAGIVGSMPTVPYIKQFDVIAGHLPHGFFPSVYSQNDAFVKGRHTRVLVTWMRHPLSMVISSAIYLMSKQGKKKIVAGITSDEVIKKVLTKLRHKKNIIPNLNSNAISNDNTREVYYSQFLKYLLPGGLEAAASMSHAEILAEIRKTFEEYAVIGILEKHQTSLQMLKYTLDPEVSLTDQFWNDMYSIEKNVVGNRHSNRANKRKNGAKFKKTVFMPRRIMAGTEGGDVNIDTFHSNESRNRKLLTSDLIKETDTVEAQVTTSGIQSLIAQNSTLSELISKSLSLEIQIYDMAVEINRKQCLFLKIPSIDCN